MRSRVLSVGIIPVYLGSPVGRPLFLLLRCFGYWDFPKGILQSGEEPIEGALRELQEETTLERVEFPWGRGYRETSPYGRGKVARYYVARVFTQDVSLPVSHELGHPEHHEYRWVDAEEARRLLSPRVLPIFDWARSALAAVA